MQNAGLDEVQAEIKTAGRNINDLRYADDTTLMAESEEELNSLTLKKVSETVDLNSTLKKTNITASVSITSQQTEGKKVEAVTDFLFLGSKMTTDSDCSHEIKRCLLLGRKAMTNLDSILKRRDIAADKGPSSQSYGFFSGYVQM